MSVPEVRPRHYAQPPELVRRSVGDVTAEFQRGRVVAAPILAELLPPRPLRPRLVASAGGAIARLLLTVPTYAARAQPLATVYRDLLDKLPSQTRFLVLAHESVAATVGGWRDGLDVVSAPEHVNFSVWAEDGYAAVIDDGTTYLVDGLLTQQTAALGQQPNRLAPVGR
jgi:hypothetical protein